MANLKMMIGEENFELYRKSGGYYIDKTGMIAELLKGEFKVNLITRPRRFGKTLTMSMLKNFFDIRKDSREIFEGLEISRQEKLCREWMNQWPVLFLSFKDLTNLTFESSFEQLAFTISGLCIEHDYLGESDKIDASDRECFIRLKNRTATKLEVRNSLLLLTRMMDKHYGKPVILLIDEYDVPLAKASEYGYYREMLDVIQNLMSTAFKTNDFLKFAIVTGCLRIARESIFTGTNHFVTNSIYEGDYLDKFGFTEEEVKTLLAEAGQENQLDGMRKWYDGYHFGEYDVYCPWDVVNHVAALGRDAKKKPGNYWKDTSHNDIIQKFIGREDMEVNDKFEILLAGGYIRVVPSEELTYDFKKASEQDFWSILYLTGYLTKAKLPEKEYKEQTDGEICLKIPNEEIRTIFGNTIVEWFKKTIVVRAKDRTAMFEAWWGGDDAAVTGAVSDILYDTISYYDYREDYYHAFVAGLFSGAGYLVSSNEENGLGRSDIVVKDRKNRRVLIIEVKRSKSEKQMEKDVQKALEQADLMQYARKFLRGYKTILCYGAAFFEKSCMIRKVVLEGAGEGSIFGIE